MNYQKERTRCGRFMFTATVKASRFLIDHMWLYYVLNYTWGIITTLFGWLIYLFVLIFMHRHIVNKGKFGPSHFLQLFDNWGGLELGVNFLVADKMGSSWTLHTKQHELGHTFQNAVWGPFALFISFIPSVIRYWVRKKMKDPKPYDAAWYEGSATTVGEIYYQIHSPK